MTNTHCFIGNYIFGEPRLIFVSLLLLAWVMCSCSSADLKRETWQVYKGDAASSSYSSLTQITKDNVSRLEVSWIFEPTDAPEGARAVKYECNPIVVGPVMYLTSARHVVYALEAASGKVIWSFDPFDGKGGAIKRGVSYWEGNGEKRILFTARNHLFALNATNGEQILGFGEQGKVNLNIENFSGEEAWVVPTSPGIIYNDLIILGSEVSESYGAAPGYIRAYNVLTGKLEWTFHTIPQPGEVGYDTWPADAWKKVGGANNWGGMSLDEKRSIVYIPLGSPTYDYYGSDRKGMNLFGNSLVALEAATGKLVWYFQTTHHDLWDYDLPAPPNLITVTKNGKQIDAVAQTTKTGLLFVLDRETGEPIFPVEERLVPASNIPGEEAWPTQPFPTKPLPYSKQYISESDLLDFTPDAKKEVLDAFKRFRYEGIYTPPDTSGTLLTPGSRGGSEWGGAAWDQETGLLYLNANESPEIAKVSRGVAWKSPRDQSMYNVGRSFYTTYCASCHGTNKQATDPSIPSLVDVGKRLSKEEILNRVKNGKGKMPAFGQVAAGNEDEIISYLLEINKDKIAEKPTEESDTGMVYLNLTAYGYFRDNKGRPAIKPPWGTLNAINLNTGEYSWRVPLGNIPELQQPGDPPTGIENYGGPVVTAGGLVFIAATGDQKIRAFDKETGDEVWTADLPGNGYASPAVYEANGKQHLAIAVTGNREKPGGWMVVFSLP
ncbi:MULTISPECIES: PQQ-binding-like beta-propeller repeat protein [unclassified Imperialibacter]|uniref:outer membrane protein assembly factor BamB family protein n=1 Tax=unclassified Imperialibacter TaxID=2629706 RepID=UPI00125B02AA|nr:MULTISPECIES: PQQ-binding-like beta-propeller repeat protein [unclassified Imperialibacter]CAD5259485.1 Pyrroloquinoline quinone-dependent dehydrogenase [Imperialibacter sp. 75]CAD5297678.1 Pyrroloquinoline quinone-dependent dehydrogenase [Imperialibacter sp. 89]VVT02348.1 Quinoprotein glucose dehydrogenase [Imperialibacter sp. EC-SDR9]